MAGEVEEAGAAAFEPVTERGDGVLHLLLGGVDLEVNREARLLKDFGHRGGIVDRIQQRCA